MRSNASRNKKAQGLHPLGLAVCSEFRRRNHPTAADTVSAASIVVAAVAAAVAVVAAFVAAAVACLVGLVVAVVAVGRLAE